MWEEPWCSDFGKSGGVVEGAESNMATLIHLNAVAQPVPTPKKLLTAALVGALIGKLLFGPIGLFIYSFILLQYLEWALREKMHKIA